MKILIVKLGALGDVINTFPLVNSLKTYLDCDIHWLVAPLSLPLVAAHQSVDKVIVFDKKQGLEGVLGVVRQLKKINYDIVLDLQRILKSGFFTWAAKGRRKIGFDLHRSKEMSGLFPFERILPASPARHMLDQYMEFAAHLGIPKDPVRWDIPRRKPAESVDAVLPEHYIVLNVGATKPANLWRPDYFADLSLKVEKQFSLPCVLTGGPEDMKTGEYILEKGAATLVNLTGKTSLHDLVEVLARARAVVACDTGPMHLATALGRRVIALFGPSAPGRTGPYFGEVIQKQMACSPCNRKRCDHPLCMDAVTPDDVMALLGKLP